MPEYEGPDGGLNALVWGTLVAGASAVFLVPLSVKVVAASYDMRTSYPLMLLGSALGMAVGIVGAGVFESVIPLLIATPVVTVLFGAITAEPNREFAPRFPAAKILAARSATGRHA